ncbi:class I SAM-dependent methyltransferase [Actinacidiphila sp. ITFR-21]|uniref:class I SAM-dependent methyltransferase n=1 Tax=Actinacidiphila sp. ITFR-21 TaxID=3075199 RepID=UPI00288A916E|nr:methyltransferase domain-containing protein [Streptomyces sp. ITFR-21]WNI19417.1 methyltransferase domain-containing protein [Streptomyces sp. ITFR-21]
MTSVSADPAFPGWDWEDPEGLDATMARFTENLAACRSLETVSARVPRSRQELRELGLTGIEFAAFRTPHPEGLGTDLLPLYTPDARTEPGPVYLVDGAHRFTQLDIGDPLPFDDAAVDWVYAEHLVEHVPLGTVIGWLREVRRVLRPGGVLRLTTPDLERYVHGYLEEKGGFFARHRRRLRTLRVGPPMPERRAFMVNQIFYHFGHRWIYDEAELRHALAAAGFDNWRITRQEYREGARADVAALDTGFRRDETLYLEAAAPAAPPREAR